MFKPHFFNREQTGFSLVEILVGLAIGMLGVIVMMQVFSLSEARKRNATGSGDAQSNGAIVFYQLQRDIGQAGYGMSSEVVFNCQLTWNVGVANTPIATSVRLAPVTINANTANVPLGDPNTDTLLIMYGAGDGQPQGNIVNAQASNVYTMQMPTSFNVGDRVIAAPKDCGSTTLPIDKITAQDVTTVTTVNGGTAAALYNLGPSPVVLAYAIRGGNLTMCDYMVNDCGLAENVTKPDVWVPIANNIVSLRASYLRNTTLAPLNDVSAIRTYGSGQADLDPSVYPDPKCNWMRTTGVRLALVARSGEFDKEAPSNASNQPKWAEEATLPIIDGTNVLGAGTAAGDWANYRYKVFESMIALRNVTLLGSASGC